MTFSGKTSFSLPKLIKDKVESSLLSATNTIFPTSVFPSADNTAAVIVPVYALPLPLTAGISFTTDPFSKRNFTLLAFLTFAFNVVSFKMTDFA